MKNQPSIALGTWAWGAGFAGGDQVFGNNLGVEELKPVFDEAMANGLNLWDSAVVYGMGASETLLSTFTRNCKREDVLISTKFTPQIADDSENPVADMLAGKDLIIQHAAGLTDAVQNELDDLMEKDRSGMIVVLIDTPENLEALHAHNTSLASKFQYIGSDENASAQKEADTEMEAALKRSTEKQEQIARDVVNAEQETEEEPEQEDAEALQEEPEYEKEETDILEESSEPETDEEDEEEPEPEEYVPPKKAKLFAKQEKPQKKAPVTEEEPELPEETASAAEEEVVPEDYDDKEEMDPDEFAQYACKYATEIDCSITGKSLLALYERIEMMEEDEVHLTKAAAVDLIEEAADKAEKKSLGKKIAGLFSPTYTKEGLLILHEKDFFD